MRFFIRIFVSKKRMCYRGRGYSKSIWIGNKCSLDELIIINDCIKVNTCFSFCTLPNLPARKPIWSFRHVPNDLLSLVWAFPRLGRFPISYLHSKKKKKKYPERNYITLHTSQLLKGCTYRTSYWTLINHNCIRSIGNRQELPCNGGLWGGIMAKTNGRKFFLWYPPH